MTSRLVAYRDLLLAWNERVNLTAARTAAEVDAHVEDCLAIVAHVPREAIRLVDVGSGGGLPAVVIAIERPDAAITALEPTHKKHAFLRTAARTLGLPNLEPLAERWEDHGGRGYDVATSRATFAIGAWLDVGASLVRRGGLVLGMEARDQLAELPAGVERHAYELASGDKTRAILVRRT
jgi:16S rRNA (guanine527-N7)-methyltransferase